MEESEKQRLREQLEKVDEVLEGRDRVHESLVSELDEEIEKQKDRLSSAPNSEENRIRDVLKELYRERRQEVRAKWRDRESWVERRQELEERLSEIRDLDDLDF